MKIQRLCALAALSAAGTLLSGAQVVQVRLTAAEVNTGDTLGADLTLDPPSPCDTSATLMLSNETQYLILSGNVYRGKPVHLQVQVGKDHDPGTLHSSQLTLYHCPGYDKNVSIRPPALQDVSVTVHAIPDQTLFPKAAGVFLSLTQQQFFNTKVAELRRLEQRLATEVAGKGADRPELRQFLIQIIRDATHDLTVTQSQYPELMLKKGEALPMFFPEFHQRYAELITKLEALPPDMKHTSVQGLARIIYVQQLRKREPSTDDVPPHNSTGFSPSIVVDIDDTLKDNESAYRYNQETGRHDFDIAIRSNPQHAQVYYKPKIKEVYQPVAGQTDIDKITLEMGSWDFRFHLDGCPDQFYPENSFRDHEHIASVEFPKGCHRTR